MDMPELIWKSWIDFEFEEEEYDRTRELYERLLRRTSHVKVWVSFAQFEANAGFAEARALSGEDDDEDEDEEEGEKAEAEPKEIDLEAVERAKQDGLERARKVYERGYADLKNKSLKDEVRLFPIVSFSADDKCSSLLRIQQRVVLLNAWKEMEVAYGDAEHVGKVEAMLPRVVKKMRKVDDDSSMMEECKSSFDFALPTLLLITFRFRLRHDLCRR
jgi:crooked neck